MNNSSFIIQPMRDFLWGCVNTIGTLPGLDTRNPSFPRPPSKRKRKSDKIDFWQIKTPEKSKVIPFQLLSCTGYTCTSTHAVMYPGGCISSRFSFYDNLFFMSHVQNLEKNFFFLFLFKRKTLFCDQIDSAFLIYCRCICRNTEMRQNNPHKIKYHVLSSDLLSVIMTSSLAWREALSVVGINGAWIAAKVMVKEAVIGTSVHWHLGYQVEFSCHIFEPW